MPRGVWFFGLIALSIFITACSETQAPEPAPQASELEGDEIGYYCNMLVVNHQGPKGQIFVAGTSSPLWFTSVRDVLAFTMLPEEPKHLSAIYVNDMGQASWEQPEAGTWIEARKALFVIGSNAKGGMGASELVPFSQRKKAEQFVAERGGAIFGFDEIAHTQVFEVATPP